MTSLFIPCSDQKIVSVSTARRLASDFTQILTQMSNFLNDIPNTRKSYSPISFVSPVGWIPVYKLTDSKTIFHRDVVLELFNKNGMEIQNGWSEQDFFNIKSDQLIEPWASIVRVRENDAESSRCVELTRYWHFTFNSRVVFPNKYDLFTTRFQ